MANRTVKDAKNVHGTNPQYLIEKIIRSRIYDSKYWKEQCFALTAELLVDKAMDIRFVGGVFGGNIKPTPFLCLTLKMLQIQPEKDIVVEFIKNEEFKYVRALGAFYLRLTGSSQDCYKYLEPLYNDNRKLRRQNRMGHYELVHMDEFIDELLREERVCDIILPRIQKRLVLEENNELDPKVSALDDDLDEEMPSDDENLEEIAEALKAKEKEKKLETIRIRDSRRDRSGSRERQAEKAKDSGAYKERGADRYRDYDRGRERDYERRESPDNRYKDREMREKERDRERRHERDRNDRNDDRNRDRTRYDDRDRDRNRERERVDRGGDRGGRERDRGNYERERDRERDYDRRRR
ncbi:pre-mRNA-splicing factor 38-like [Uranotaenia lowii]|uniref:pre-mRNA-splicing factor 38-like n=1 Tax=Uranotaenia lowii TaxID=190385 RepID=UPI002479C0B0|nr:pre-mRNA-splicing factor 38-like [Uranotaenia lowii]